MSGSECEYKPEMIKEARIGVKELLRKWRRAMGQEMRKQKGRDS